MAIVDENALTSGVLHGIEIAVAGDLISAGEVLDEEHPISSVIRDAREVTDELVGEASDGSMPSWRQVITGEIVGTAVAARTSAGISEQLTAEDLREALAIIFKKIDKFPIDPWPDRQA